MNPSPASRPIGLFDSGIGGLTVFSQVAKLLPREDLVYFGDTARLPYGTKSSDTIIRFSLENAAFLLEKNIKLLIVACHTASAHALDILQKNLPIPVIGVIEAGLNLLLQTTRSQRVAVLATASTISSGIYERLILQRRPFAKVFSIPCPLFVPLAEELLFSHPAATAIAHHYLEPIKTADIDAVLLACTHYPLLRNVIEETIGANIKILEPAQSCALLARQLLERSGLLNPQTSPPSYQFYATDNPVRCSLLAKSFLNNYSCSAIFSAIEEKLEHMK